MGAFLFWGGVLTLVYQYVGYPLLLSLLARLRPDVERGSYASDDELPSVTLIISAYNEEEVLDRKLENAVALDYPKERLEIVVVSDGSTDRTTEIAESFADRGVVLHEYTENRGKNLALNESMPRVRGDITVFTDANGMYEPDAMKKLVQPFADATVGSVCGELVYRNFNENAIAEGYNRYWELDQMQKRLESDLGTLLGANGSIFGVRTTLCRPIPNDTCNDMVQPIWVGAAGHKCLYEPGALSIEAGSKDLDDELKRRSRIIGRGIRGILAVWPDIVRGRAKLLGLELLSRKGLRYLTPVWFLMIFIGSGLATGLGLFYQLAFAAQVLAYGAIPVAQLLPEGRLQRLVSPAVYFGIANLAATMGWWKVLTGSELGRWNTADRPFETGSDVAPSASDGSD
ncbi:MAG: glycosyltransferase family 2 protein [Candidatus Binatia bacterium]|nr:glycosyltransferase family 2 protein [Candidatus Binatia bacterium]